MSKTKLLSIAVIGLLVHNLSLSGFHFLRKPIRPKDRPIGQAPPERFRLQNEIIASLRFDDIQVKKYEVLIDEHQESVKALNDSIRNVKSLLYQMLNSENDAAKDSLITKIGSLQKNIERTHYEHFVEIKKLCNTDQLRNFEELTTRLAGFFGSTDQNRPRE